VREGQKRRAQFDIDESRRHVGSSKLSFRKLRYSLAIFIIGDEGCRERSRLFQQVSKAGWNNDRRFMPSGEWYNAHGVWPCS
jgi:hypothetical protein